MIARPMRVAYLEPFSLFQIVKQDYTEGCEHTSVSVCVCVKSRQ